MAPHSSCPDADARKRKRPICRGQPPHPPHPLTFAAVFGTPWACLKDITMIPSVLPTYNRAPLSFVKGEGSWLTAEDGRRYLDLGAGIAVNALGHANPELIQALTDQAAKVWHVSNVYTIPEQERLAEMLV